MLDLDGKRENHCSSNTAFQVCTGKRDKPAGFGILKNITK